MAEKVGVSQTISREWLNMIETGKFPPGSELPTIKIIHLYQSLF